MLQLFNFGHMTTSTIKIESSFHGQKLWCHNLRFKILCFKKARVVNFADISQFVTMVIRTNCKDWKKVKRVRSYLIKGNLHLYFLIQKKLQLSSENIVMSTKPKVCVTWFIFIFWISFRKSITALRLIIVEWIYAWF